jgi:amino acid transporter
MSFESTKQALSTASSGVAPATKVVVATTVMLSFISFWKAAAIVLCDLGSSAFYAGSIAEGAIGKSGPWFILGIMLFSYAVRAIYIESCSMFVRGGVYRVVHEALGPTLAKFSVSALLFDYVLTGPISGVSAGLYFAGLINETARLFNHSAIHVDSNTFAACFAVAVTLYFWRKNTIGIHESSQKALRIMQLTTVMVVTMIVWCVATLLTKGFQWVPFPSPENMKYGEGALGWLEGSGLTLIPAIAILVGLGHSVLAMSGEETLAQVNREIAAPKLKNLKRAGLVIFLYSMLFTSLVSFFAVMIIPDNERSAHLGNLIGGLAMHMVGPLPLRLLFHAFVVVVGTVMLAGAVNSAIVGSNGVLNRVAEDGVLPDWFRHPHRKYGTTYRFLLLVAGLQIATIIISRGQIELLGEAYAFGVVWSFAMKALSVLVLRFKQPQEREWKVPMNFRVGKIEIPLGLGLITLALFILAITNVLTKKVATISGFAFALIFFIAFEITEKIYHRKRITHGPELEKFRLEVLDDVSSPTVNIRPDSIMVAVHNPDQLEHLQRVLAKTDTRRLDIAVVTVKPAGYRGMGEYQLHSEQLFSADIERLFSKVVSLAEKAGKHVELIVVPGRNPNTTIAETAQRIRSSHVVMGLSAKMTAAEQAKQFGDAWEKLPHPRPQITLQILDTRAEKYQYFNLGPHPPRLWPEDIDLLHHLWLEISARGFGAKLHHRDVVRVALRRLDKELHSDLAPEIIRHFVQEVIENPVSMPAAPQIVEVAETTGMSRISKVL